MYTLEVHTCPCLVWARGGLSGRLLGTGCEGGGTRWGRKEEEEVSSSCSVAPSTWGLMFENCRICKETHSNHYSKRYCFKWFLLLFLLFWLLVSETGHAWAIHVKFPRGHRWETAVQPQMWGEHPVPHGKNLTPRWWWGREEKGRVCSSVTLQPGWHLCLLMSENNSVGYTGALVYPGAFLQPASPVHCFLDASGGNQIKSKLEPSPGCQYLPFLNPVQLHGIDIKHLIWCLISLNYHTCITLSRIYIWNTFRNSVYDSN